MSGAVMSSALCCMSELHRVLLVSLMSALILWLVTIGNHPLIKSKKNKTKAVCAAVLFFS